jgi:hypothetical protein
MKHSPSIAKKSMPCFFLGLNGTFFASLNPMNAKAVRTRCWICLVFLLAGAGEGLLQASEPTAFELIDAGNQYLCEQARDRVVRIRSEKSDRGITPIIWYVVYYDQTAAFKEVEVKFGAGMMLDVKRPKPSSASQDNECNALDRKKMKIDSDEALAIAVDQTTPHSVQVKASEACLEPGTEGTPTWKVRLWGSDQSKPEDEIDIGQLLISAEDGSILKNELHASLQN